jgi:hypothetical protein
MTERERIFELVNGERIRQDTMWGEQNHVPPLWVGILGEEYGELCEAVNETFLKGAYPERGGYEKIKEEAIQVAAVAVALLECIERNKGWWQE